MKKTKTKSKPKRRPLTKREQSIVHIIGTHLPPKKFGSMSQTGGAVCGLLDILSLLTGKVPYKLEAE